MTGLEITLIIIGIVIVIASFLFGESIEEKRGSSGMRNLDGEEIKETVKTKVDEAVDDAIDDIVEKTDAELDKISNEKIMAVSEYSDGILKEIEKNHEEVMFLYDMLSDKEEQIKDTVRDVEMVRSSVKRMKTAENDEAFSKDENRPDETNGRNLKSGEKDKMTDAEKISPVANNNKKILNLYEKGKTNIEIAKELNLGIGEVRLVIDLYRARGTK